jgi:hypothetical protein
MTEKTTPPGETASPPRPARGERLEWRRPVLRRIDAMSARAKGRARSDGFLLS